MRHMRRGMTAVALAFLLCVAGCGGGSSSEPQTKGASTSTFSPSAGSTKKLSPLAKARDALGSNVHSDFAVGDSKVRSVDRSGVKLDVVLTTPEGGIDGPSTGDADGLASATFAKVYLSGWKGPATVRFLGGLQNSATGKALPNALAFGYRMQPGPARQIDWSNQDTLYSIDWSHYRWFCHPAFKGC